MLLCDAIVPRPELSRLMSEDHGSGREQDLAGPFHIAAGSVEAESGWLLVPPAAA